MEAGFSDFLEVGTFPHVAILIWLAVGALRTFAIMANRQALALRTASLQTVSTGMLEILRAARIIGVQLGWLNEIVLLAAYALPICVNIAVLI